MLSKVFSYGTSGIEAYPVEIEVDINRGLPSVTIVGLPDSAVKESKERVKSAIKNSGFSYPDDRITIGLAPADIKKEGPAFDLAIALGILAASGQLNQKNLRDYIFLGELSLEGILRPIKGTLPVALCMSKDKFTSLVLPSENGFEAALVGKINVYPINNLSEAVNFLSEPQSIRPLKIDLDRIFKSRLNYELNFEEVKGQSLVKRALEVAVAGSHNLLLIGPPGSGKTMLAKRIPTIMPDMTLEEALETTRIHSVMGLVKAGIIATRPFRSVHHTISDIAMVGGGSIPKPGEISLAHNGVLFLDELPEFHRDVLEVLRQPLEDGLVTVSRVTKSLSFPCKFMLVAAMNPCPCGTLGQLKSACRCSTTQVYKYRSKISGPLLDRIDIHLEVPAVRYEQLSSKQPVETSLQIRERVNKARLIQRERFKDTNIHCNGQMSHKQVRKFCELGKEEAELLKMAMTELNFSARAYDKILKVSRTIADLSGSENIKTEHLSEAIQYRSLDRDFFV